MPILVSCSGCNAKLNAPDTAAGKKIRCPKCQNVIDVPGASSKAITPSAPAPASEPAPAPASAPPPLPSTLPPATTDQPYDDDYDRPRRKKKRRGKPSGGPDRTTVGILALILNGLGIHKFMLGYSGAGTIMLVGWIVGLFCTGGIVSMVFCVIGIIEGVIYLTKSDEEFYDIYVANKKEWF